MDLATALEWAAGRHSAVLITLRADGRPQSSDVACVCDGTTFTISVTADRAKTANMRRDPRVVLHLTDPSIWSYVSFDGTTELSSVSAEVDDETVDRLVEYYRKVSGGEHPAWDEYRQTMVTDRRLVVTFTPRSAVGQING